MKMLLPFWTPKKCIFPPGTYKVVTLLKSSTFIISTLSSLLSKQMKYDLVFGSLMGKMNVERRLGTTYLLIFELDRAEGIFCY